MYVCSEHMYLKNTHTHTLKGFLGGSVVENPSANAEEGN